MSAWIVSKQHIDTMVHASIALLAKHGGFGFYFGPTGQPRSEWTRLSHFDADTHDLLGQILTDENVRSVGYRYPVREMTVAGSLTPADLLHHADLPGPSDKWYLQPYRFPRFSLMNNPLQRCPLTPGELAKAIDCYAYQSCEHPEWEKSSAYAICQALRSAILHGLPGYEEAPWGIE